MGTPVKGIQSQVARACRPAEEIFQFHPLVNTSTLLISRENLKRFFRVTGHEVRLLDVSSQA